MAVVVDLVASEGSLSRQTEKDLVVVLDLGGVLALPTARQAGAQDQSLNGDPELDHVVLHGAGPFERERELLAGLHVGDVSDPIDSPAGLQVLVRTAVPPDHVVADSHAADGGSYFFHTQDDVLRLWNMPGAVVLVIDERELNQLRERLGEFSVIGSEWHKRAILKAREARYAS